MEVECAVTYIEIPGQDLQIFTPLGANLQMSAAVI